MPLPDAPDYSKRIYELLKETDLESLTYSQFQGVAEKLFIEPENEDEMRRLVLIQLARMAVRGDWDGFLTGGGGGGGAPTDAEYVVMALNGTLTNERKLTAGTGISITDGGAGGDVTIASTVTSGIGGSITNDQVARGATAADDIEGSNGLLFDGTSLTVNTLSASDPVVNLASNTKSVSLEVNTSQKLSVKGGSNSFVFDASSATGGITFPDSTVQNTASPVTSLIAGTNITLSPVSGLGDVTITAASGGGGGAKPTIASSMPASYDMFFLTSLPPYTRSVLASSTNTITTSPLFIPFLAPTDITGLALEISVNTAGVASNMIMCLYESSTSTGNPTTKVTNSDLTIDATTTGYKTGTFSSSVALTNNLVYWVGLCSDNANITVRTHTNDNAPAVCLLGGLGAFNKSILKDNVATTSLPATITDANLEPSYALTPMVGLQI